MAVGENIYSFLCTVYTNDLLCILSKTLIARKCMNMLILRSRYSAVNQSVNQSRNILYEVSAMEIDHHADFTVRAEQLLATRLIKILLIGYGTAFPHETEHYRNTSSN